MIIVITKQVTIGFDEVKIDHCIYEIVKKLIDEFLKDLPKVPIIGECLNLDGLIDFVY